MLVIGHVIYVIWQKQKKLSFGISTHNEAHIFDLAHLDMVTNIFLTILDDCNRNVWIVILKAK